MRDTEDDDSYICLNDIDNNRISLVDKQDDLRNVDNDYQSEGGMDDDDALQNNGAGLGF